MAQLLNPTPWRGPALRCVEVPKELWLPESVDLHDHLRNKKADGDGRMEMSVPLAAGEHGMIVSIWNTGRVALNQDDNDALIQDAYSFVPEGSDLQIGGAWLMNDSTTAAMVVESRTIQPRTTIFLKVFLSGVSLDGGNSVSDLRNIDLPIRMTYDDVLDAPELPVHIHAERKFDRYGRRIRMRDREWYAINHDVRQLLTRHPQGVFVIKHVSDKRTLRQIEEWQEQGYRIYAEISAHYLYRCHDDLYEGPGGGTAFNANDLCWPCYKDADSMKVLRKAVVKGKALHGSDRAMHLDDPTRSSGVKITDDGIVCGGVCITPATAKSLIIDLFVEEGAVDKLDDYLSGNARRIHHLLPSRKQVCYVREPWTVPALITGEGPNGPIRARPFMRGQTCNWQRVA